MKKKFSIRKYDGDDAYSYAVFFAKDVKNIRGQIFYHDARPLVCGCTKREAVYHSKEFEKERQDAEEKKRRHEQG